MDSPFKHLFDTNYVPTSEDCKLIISLLETPRLQVQNLCHEIATVQLKLDNLVTHKRLLTEYIDKHTALLTPIRRLPDDILREIFHHTLPPSEVAGSMAHTDFPMVLTRVCTSWRRIALTSPHLWTSIHINVPNQHIWQNTGTEGRRLTQTEFLSLGRQVHQDRIRGIQGWISRAGMLPLTIAISCAEVPDETSFIAQTSFVTDVVEVLLPHASRWRGLACKMVTPKFAPLLRLPASRFPLLESISIHAVTWDGKGRLRDLLMKSQLAKCSSLKTLRLEGARWLITDGVPWSQLRHLSLDSMIISIDSLAECIAQCHLLITLQFYGRGEVEYRPLQGEPIMLPYLVNLSVADGVNHISPIFGRLCLPALENMKYAHQQGGSSWLTSLPIEQYSIYKTLVAAHIQTLDIDPDALPSGGLIRCLEHCPGLRFLYLRSTYVPEHRPRTVPPNDTIARSIDASFFQILSERGADNKLAMCPLLEELTSVMLFTVKKQVVLDFLIARQGLIRRLAVKLVAKDGDTPGQHEDGDIVIDLIPTELQFKLDDAKGRYLTRGEPWFVRYSQTN